MKLSLLKALVGVCFAIKPFSKSIRQFYKRKIFSNHIIKLLKKTKHVHCATEPSREEAKNELVSAVKYDFLQVLSKKIAIFA